MSFAAGGVYMFAHLIVIKGTCFALGEKSEGCEKLQKLSKKVEKIVKQITLPRNILIAILGEKALAYYASSTFSGTVITTALKGVALSAQQFGAAILTASFTPVGVVAVGALAVGGIYWYWNRSKKQQYDKTARHLLRGGKVLLPEGWHMWVHPQAASLWFAHPASGRIQEVFPTETEFVDKRGRRVADMTLEFGINRPTNKQKALAKELAASIGDEDRMRRALAMWIYSKPRPGAKLLAEHHILKRLVGESSFAELRQRKRLSAGGNYLRAIRVLSDGHLGISKSVLGLIGKHATYHDLRSLVLI